MRLSNPTILLLLIALCLLAGQYLTLTHTAEKAVRNALTEATQLSNETVTRLFVNSALRSIIGKLPLSPDPDADAAVTDDDFASVDQKIREFILGTDVVKVKIFNKAGRVLYSTDSSQIGSNAAANPHFRSAVSGMTASLLSHRGDFHAAEGLLYERDLVSSYVPIRGDNELIIGVAELYTDRTPAIQDIKASTLEFSAFVALFTCTLVLLFAGLIWFQSTGEA